MVIDEYIPLISIGVSIAASIIAGIYAVTTNTKKYELEEHYKRELIAWYEKTIFIVMALLEMPEQHEKKILLSQLSALIEVGRFYFPNVRKDDGFGEKKPSAYRGYRHLALDFLVYIYQIMKREDCNLFTKELRSMEQHFTSLVFDCIEPSKRKRQLKKHADYILPTDKTITDLANDKSDSAIKFWESIYGVKK